ncbi:FAD-binding oxidoreductase [Nocardia sp. NPDC004068]|uniref:FAD-binding oxidoreductase n=1 Tax=Nocardia sp. NPDC004068 TaxID=3364303 RepID=UPI003691C7DA
MGPARPPRFSRRALLAGAAGAVATQAFPAGPAHADEPGPDAWNDLRNRLRGTVTRPGDDDFAARAALYEPRFDTATPLAVTRPADPDDVRTAVRFARDHDLPLTARAGGHSYVGASATPGALVVDLRDLTAITVDGDLVTVGAGATAYAVQEALAPADRTLPLGTCPTVGVAGLTLGGGLGTLSRRYGLTCDRLVSARVVLPTGAVADVAADRMPELFWALRGAGAAVGVVTDLTYRTCPAESEDIVRLGFPGIATVDVITGWARWLTTVDRAVWSNLEISATASGLGCAAKIVCPAGQGPAAAADLAAAAHTAPTSVDQRTLPHLDAVRALGGGASTPRSNKIAGSDVLAALSPDIAQRITDTVAARSRSGARGYVLVDPLDGAVHDTAPDATAFPWRAHAATLQWIVDEPDDPAAARAWITDAHRAVGATAAYVNYLEPDPDPARYYGPNLDRLRRLTAAADPGRLLRPGIGL